MASSSPPGIPFALIGQPNGVVGTAGSVNTTIAGALAHAMQRPLQSRFAELATITDYASYCGTLPISVNGSTVDWQPAFQAAIADLCAKGGGRLRIPNNNPGSTGQTVYNLGAPVFATADGTLNTLGPNLHFEGERGAVIQQTQYVTGGQVITPGMVFPGAVNPATSGNVTVGGTTGTLYGYAPALMISGSDCRVESILFQCIGNPPGTVTNIPQPPATLQGGINYCAGIYHLNGDRPIFEHNTFNNFEVCISSQGVNGSSTLQAQDVRVLNNNWGSSYSFGLLIRKFNGLYFCNNNGGGAAYNPNNPNPPHDLYVTDRAETPYRNAIVIGNNTTNGQQANPLKIRNVIGGVIANNRSDSSSGHIQVEFSTDILITGNFATNQITQDDSGAAQIRLVDSWRCTAIGNGCSISDNSTGIAAGAILLTADEKNTGTLTLPPQTFTFSATQTGTALTLASALPAGTTLFPGMTLTGSGATTQTVVSGSGLNYVVSQSQTLAATTFTAAGVSGTLNSTLTATFTGIEMNVSAASGAALIPGMVLVDPTNTMIAGTTIVSQQPTPAVTFTGVMTGTNIMTVSNILPAGTALTPGMVLQGGPYNFSISSVQSSTSITMNSAQTLNTAFSTNVLPGGIGLYSTTQSQTIATPLSLTASTTTSQVFLPVVSKLYAKNINDTTIVGCSLISYAGTGAGQTVTILGNTYAAAKNAVLGLVTVAPAPSTAWDGTTVAHYYDPTNGHHYIQGYKATITQGVGEGTNPFKINGCDCNILENIEFSDLSGYENGQPFYFTNTYGNTIIHPRTSHPVTALNASGVIGNTGNLATLSSSTINTTFLIRPEIWSNYSTGSIGVGSSVNTAIVNEAFATVSFLGLASNVTPSVASGNTSIYQCGTSSAQWQYVCSGEFVSYDPTGAYSTYLNYGNMVYSGTAGFQFKSSTGPLQVTFPSILLRGSSAGSDGITITPNLLKLNSAITIENSSGSTIIDSLGNLYRQSYAITGLPTPGASGETAYCSNAGGIAVSVDAISGNWRRAALDMGVNVWSADPGTTQTLTYLTSAPTQIVTATPAANCTFNILPGTSSPTIMPIGTRWRFVYAPTGSPTTTISVTYNGGSSLVTLTANSYALFEYDGTTLRLIGFSGASSTASPSTVYFSTTSGTWTPDTSAVAFDIFLCGGGGGGGSGALQAAASAASGGGGGGAGQIVPILNIRKSDVTSTTVAYTIGAAGTGGAAVTGASAVGGNAGGAGGSTTLNAAGSGFPTGAIVAHGGGGGGPGNLATGSYGGSGAGISSSGATATSSAVGGTPTGGGAGGSLGSGGTATGTNMGAGGGGTGSGFTANAGGGGLLGGPGGGGSGGGVTAGGVAEPGALGGIVIGAPSALEGTAGVVSTTSTANATNASSQSPTTVGCGGAGGAGAVASGYQGVGGNGGNGAGGGGGGAGTIGCAGAGTGGNGGGGFILIIGKH
jgi:hypothetical protein